MITSGEEIAVTNYDKDQIEIFEFGVNETYHLDGMFRMIIPAYLNQDNFYISQYELCRDAGCNE